MKNIFILSLALLSVFSTGCFSNPPSPNGKVLSFFSALEDGNKKEYLKLLDERTFTYHSRLFDSDHDEYIFSFAQEKNAVEGLLSQNASIAIESMRLKGYTEMEKYPGGGSYMHASPIFDAWVKMRVSQYYAKAHPVFEYPEGCYQINAKFRFHFNENGKIEKIEETGTGSGKARPVISLGFIKYYYSEPPPWTGKSEETEKEQKGNKYSRHVERYLDNKNQGLVFFETSISVESLKHPGEETSRKEYFSDSFGKDVINFGEEPSDDNSYLDPSGKPVKPE